MQICRDELPNWKKSPQAWTNQPRDLRSRDHQDHRIRNNKIGIGGRKLNSAPVFSLFFTGESLYDFLSDLHIPLLRCYYTHPRIRYHNHPSNS